MAKTKKNLKTKMNTKTKPKAKPKAKAAMPKAKTAKAKKPTKLAAKAKPKAKAKPAAKVSSKPAAKMAAKVATKAAAKVPAKKPAAPKLTLITSKSKSLGFLTPLDDRILVEKLGASDRTPGGLYIPDMAQERPNKGKVVAVGHGRRDKKGRVRPLDVQVGDVVLFTQWAGGEIELDGSTYLIMREGDVLGVSLE